MVTPGSIYTRTIIMDHTHARQVEKEPILLQSCHIYTKTACCYIGNQSEQKFELAATDKFGAKGIRGLMVDLSTLYVRAPTACAEVHIIGAVCKD